MEFKGLILFVFYDLGSKRCLCYTVLSDEGIALHCTDAMAQRCNLFYPEYQGVAGNNLLAELDIVYVQEVSAVGFRFFLIVQDKYTFRRLPVPLLL